MRRSKAPDDSRRFIISKLVVPTIKFKTISQSPGGSVMEVNHSIPHLEAAEPRFMVNGVDTSMADHMGIVDEWTGAAAYIDKNTGEAVPARCNIRGAITSWEPDEHTPGEFKGCNHGFTDVTRLELTIGDKRLFLVDQWTNELWAGETDHMAAINSALGV
jgi:hypothetical protein